MPLPKLDTPVYSVELPSTGEEVKYRPFLVKEQKVLMMAQESQDNKQMVDMMGKLIESCTFKKIDADKAPMFDIEYLFLKMRAKSIGETISLDVLCEDDGKTKVPVEINIDDVHPQITENHSNIIPITENIKLHLRYPLLKDQYLLVDDSKSDVQRVFDLLHRCVHEIHDGDVVYKRVDITNKDLEQFVDQMTTEQFEMVMEFFSGMPKLRHVIEVVNPKTKVTNHVILEGLASFLG